MRNVLFITFRFPPIVTPGTFRSGKFAKYLPEFGWRPIILTAGAAPSNQIDSRLLSELPGGIIVKTVPTKIPTLRTVTFLRKWLPMLAIDSLWRPYAFKVALKLIDQWKCEVILSTSPPPACHLLAIDLKKVTGLPVIVDYRDPWTDNPHGYYPTRWHRWHSYKLEKYVQQNADKAVTVSTAFAKKIESVIPAEERPWAKAQIIPNGYDPFDFTALNISPQPFVVSHIGSIYRGRVPVALHLVESLASLEQTDPLLSEKLVLRFIGIIDPIVEAALRTRLKHIRVELIGSVSHDEAIRHMYEASLLLLITDYVEMGSTTSKIFECLATNHPILSIGHAESVRELLAGLSDCQYVSGDSLPETISAFRKLITAYPTVRLPESQIQRQAILARYSRRALTRDLAKLLDMVTSK